MRDLKYPVQLRWSEADEAWIAEIPDLPGCVADGKTEVGAVRAVGHVAKDWIEMAESLGRPVPEPTGSSPSSWFANVLAEDL